MENLNEKFDIEAYAQAERIKYENLFNKARSAQYDCKKRKLYMGMSKNFGEDYKEIDNYYIIDLVCSACIVEKRDVEDDFFSSYTEIKINNINASPRRVKKIRYLVFDIEKRKTFNHNNNGPISCYSFRKDGKLKTVKINEDMITIDVAIKENENKIYKNQIKVNELMTKESEGKKFLVVGKLFNVVDSCDEHVNIVKAAKRFNELNK